MIKGWEIKHRLTRPDVHDKPVLPGTQLSASQNEVLALAKDAPELLFKWSRRAFIRLLDDSDDFAQQVAFDLAGSGTGKRCMEFADYLHESARKEIERPTRTISDVIARMGSGDRQVLEYGGTTSILTEDDLILEPPLDWGDIVEDPE